MVRNTEIKYTNSLTYLTVSEKISGLWRVFFIS